MSDKKPIYLLAGGRGSKSPDNILKAIFKDIGKPSPTIAYVGAATEDDTSFFQHMSAMVRSAGDCKLVHAITAPRNADLKKAREILEQTDAIYVGGGDVEAGMEVLKKKKMTGIFPDLYNTGKLVFGVSAGSIMLASEWVRWRDPDDDGTAEMFPCLGLAPIICDTHGEGDHWEELQAALSLKETGTTGYGITSGACLVVYADGRVSALGGAVARYSRDNSKVRQDKDLKPE